MKSITRHQVTKPTRWLVLFAALLVLFVPAVAFSSVATARRISAQRITAQERLEAKQRLSALGYWTGSVDGIFDSATSHALVAFQKVEHRKRTGKLTSEELKALRMAVRPLPRYSGYSHIEIDLERQILFVVDDSGTVTHILPVCTGNEEFYVDHGQVHRAHTPRGQFKVLRKIRGMRISSLGLLYYPNYLYEGIAIHGSWAMPVYADSHGCIRIPMFAAKEFSELVPLGTEVTVY